MPTILAAVDDLLFSSRIRNVARRLGVDVSFVRSLDALLERVRTGRPAMILFDLDAERIKPIEALSALRADPAGADVPTLGFVSHVHADVIAAARSAGIDTVMARSQFVAALPDILASTVTPTVRDVYRARRALDGQVMRTPLVRSPSLSRRTGGTIGLKLECLQYTGSFKIRGALWAVLRIGHDAGRETRRTGADHPVRVVTASAGNHGLALACAAAKVGLPATIFTPSSAPRAKLDAIAAFGADLRAEAPNYDSAERQAVEHARETGARFVSPYNDPDVIAGAGTAGLEVIEDAPDVGVVVVPLGGGGLISGIATAIKAISPATRIVGAEPALNPAFTTALGAGRITEIPVRETIADGLGGNIQPGSITFDIVRQLVDEVVTVTEHELREGVRDLVAHDHIVSEAAGAAAVAAVIAGKVDARGNLVAMVTGANIDLDRLRDVLAS